MQTASTLTPVTYHFGHANGFPAESYNVLFNALPAHWQRLSVSKFGHTPQYPVSANWRSQVDELIAHVKAKRPDSQPVYAVGHSFGAVISYMAACEQPSLFKGLIMFDPPLVTGVASLFFRLIKHTPYIDKLTPARLAASRRTTWPKSTDLVAYFKDKGLFKNMDKRCVEDYVHAVTRLRGYHWHLTFNADVEAELFRNVPHNLHTYYGKLACPAVLVTAKDTTVCTEQRRNPFIKGNNLRHDVLPGGHMFVLERPEAVADYITATISGWEAAQEA
ncbi:alpha/beta fold hydrolase [Alteromonas sp. H39]|uniref:alpha/beta hydrolase n=1 Tax=Alteromonas sp. H39 TaxID=3389876 RepID=UPI0039DF4CC8